MQGEGGSLDLSKNSCARINVGLQTTNKSGCWTNTWYIMQKKRNRNYRSRMLPGSYSYAGQDSTEVFSFRSSRVFERKEFAYDI